MRPKKSDENKSLSQTVTSNVQLFKFALGFTSLGKSRKVENVNSLFSFHFISFHFFFSSPSLSLSLTYKHALLTKQMIRPI